MSFKVASEILKFYFKEKQHLKKSYSMRALARRLKISPSYLSEIFSGKKRPSPVLLRKIVSALDLDTHGKQLLERSFIEEIFPETSQSIARNTDKWILESLQSFVLLQRWYYVVILDLSTCDDFQSTAHWIAQATGLPQNEVNDAVAFLLRHGFLVQKSNRWVKSKKKIHFPTQQSLPLIRSFHSQMIHRALQELNTKPDTNSFQKRLISGMTISCNPERIPVAKEKLNKALREVADYLMEGPCTDLYQINLQFFSHRGNFAV
ncbi:MAG: TIGR02147 family protein [Bdellovibrionota bacterium]